MNVSFRGEQRTRVNEGSGLLTASELLILENHEAGSGRELAMAHHILEDTFSTGDASQAGQRQLVQESQDFTYSVSSV